MHRATCMENKEYFFCKLFKGKYNICKQVYKPHSLINVCEGSTTVPEWQGPGWRTFQPSGVSWGPLPAVTTPIVLLPSDIYNDQFALPVSFFLFFFLYLLIFLFCFVFVVMWILFRIKGTKLGVGETYVLIPINLLIGWVSLDNHISSVFLNFLIDNERSMIITCFPSLITREITMLQW